MLQNAHTVLVGLLAVIGAILFKVPDTLEAGLLFILIVALLGVLLLHDARVTMLRVSCAAILLMIFAGVLCSLFPDFYKHRHPHFSFSLSAQNHGVLIIGW